MNKFSIVICVFCAALFSCKKPPVQVVADEEEISKVKVQAIDYKFFVSKSKIDYKDDKNEYNFSMNIRMKKDSLIWLSASPALGIEAIRCMISKDSVFVLDRINNRYMAYDLSFLSQKFNIPLTLPVLQSLIIGNMPFEMSSKDKLIKKPESGQLIIEQKKENLSAANYILVSSMCLDKLEMRELNSDNNLSIKYDNFAVLENNNFPFSNNITIQFKDGGESKNTYINTSHNKAEFPDKELNFPFNVPKKFEGR